MILVLFNAKNTKEKFLPDTQIIRTSVMLYEMNQILKERVSTKKKI